MPKAALITKKGFSKMVDSDMLRQKLKLKHIETKSKFNEKYQKASAALAAKGVDPGKLREHSTKIVGAGALTGALLLAPGHKGALNTIHSPQSVLSGASESITVRSPKEKLMESLKEVLPETTRPLTREEEKTLEKVFQDTIGINAKATLEGEHLNTTYGRIGAEQHLKRYPGDTVANHVPGPGQYGADRPNDILKEGIAPGLGAWGYFARSKLDMNQDTIQKEKWYAVVQTLYLSDWNTRQPYLRDWYQYRKVLIVNTQNGKAVVADIADSGPAAWTGKHYGGSPEVMDYLGGPKYKKGPVVLFFVDDPQNKVPLGPVNYDTNINIPGVALRGI